MIRGEEWGIPWGFTTFWQSCKVKNRCSRYFTDADLDLFEVLPLHQRANMKLIPDERIPLQQLPLPFTEWCLYRGHNMIDSCETW